MVILSHRALVKYVLISSFLAGHAHAENTGFADDFSTNSIIFGVGGYGSLTEQSGVFATDSKVLIRAGSENDESATAYLNVLGKSDLIEADVSLDSSSTLDGVDSRVRVRLQGVLFNESPQSEVNGEIGDIHATLDFRLNSDSSFSVSGCLSKKISDDDDEDYLIVGSDDSCVDFDVEPKLDTIYTMSMDLDRVNKLVLFTFDGTTLEAEVPATMYDSVKSFKRIASRVQGGVGVSEVSVYRVKVGDSDTDFRQGPPHIGRYRADGYDDYSSDLNRKKEVVDGRLLLSASATEIPSSLNSQLRLADHTDYLEAELMLSKQTVVDSGDGWAGIRIAGVYYSDTSEGGNSSEVGDVWVSASLGLESNNEPFAEYCVYRADTPNFTEASQLLGTNDICPRFDTEISFDTSYKVSAQLDAEGKQIIFTLDDEVTTYDIKTNVFARTEQSKRVGTRVRDLVATVVGYADNLRTSADALTDEEQVAATEAEAESESDSGSSGGGSMAPLIWLMGVFMILYRRKRHA